MKAWIVTWEGSDESVDRRKIVAVYNSRRSPEQVRKAIQQLYIDLVYSEDEKVACATDRGKNPYPAERHQFWRITCGHNPHLYARRVDNIRPSDDGYVRDEPHVRVMGPGPAR
jgi:hypothetical protein